MEAVLSWNVEYTPLRHLYVVKPLRQDAIEFYYNLYFDLQHHTFTPK